MSWQLSGVWFPNLSALVDYYRSVVINFRLIIEGSMRFLCLLVTVIFVVGLACTPDAPLVSDPSGKPMSYDTVIASGNRDGYYLEANLSLFSPDVINALQLHLQVEIAVPSKLQYGTWVLGPNGGQITADWLDFFGGQGDPPVISGRFSLHHATDDSIITFIVSLPKTVVKPTGMGF
jgi:hypothetical protein